MTTARLDFLRMDIINHPLFEKEVSFSLVASQRVPIDDHADMTHLFGSVWVNNVATIIGRNASGKTLTMKLVMGVLEMLFRQRSIDQTHLKAALIGADPISFRTYFYGSDRFLYRDDLTVAPDPDHEHQWIVQSEKVLEKKALKSMTRNSIFDFSSAKLFTDRQDLDLFQLSLLAPDDSLMRTLIAQRHYQPRTISDTLMFTNTNLPFFNNEDGKVSSAILKYLDPTIDFFSIEQSDNNKVLYRLRFVNDAEEIVSSNFATIEHYLSSGTVKGITLYQYVIRTLQTGGIIFIDELENHFNLAIVHTFMTYFSDPRINQNRATLIFSTHYADLINDLSRGDQIYIAQRKADSITLGRYSDLADRQDINRAEVFMSNYLGGTAPDYATYLKLRQQTIDMTRPNRSAKPTKTGSSYEN